MCVNERDPRLWRVVGGSGVGLKHSSYIVDLTFATLGDEWARSTPLKKAFGISHIKRFRDDHLVIANKPEKMHLFFKWLRRRIGVAFTMEIAEVSQKKVTTLAVTVSIENCRFACRALTWDSAHPTSVHRWWPLGYCVG